jgi:hypothetical protein
MVVETALRKPVSSKASHPEKGRSGKSSFATERRGDPWTTEQVSDSSNNALRDLEARLEAPREAHRAIAKQTDPQTSQGRRVRAIEPAINNLQRAIKDLRRTLEERKSRR